VKTVSKNQSAFGKVTDQNVVASFCGTLCT